MNVLIKRPRFRYVFGSNFICPDQSTAKRVTFHERILTKSVTLDGDVMDPSGTLTGGSRPNTAPVLAQLHELKKAREECAALEAQLNDIGSQLAKMQKSSAAYRKLKTQWDIKQHEHDLAKGRIEQSSCHQVSVSPHVWRTELICAHSKLGPILRLFKRSPNLSQL